MSGDSKGLRHLAEFWRFLTLRFTENCYQKRSKSLSWKLSDRLLDRVSPEIERKQLRSSNKMDSQATLGRTDHVIDNF